ncbi:putative phage O family protein [Erwinia phage PEp14]|uniref:Putative phage O family protein n=1 Tax=Erwinia phage PEp14 TaxID=1131315 RepID=H2DE83_9CAUD|nr:replication initiation O-like [Erwinia phage PEp14]AEY69642.1 putative phage O family protein [Erwinia phage PEp14]
MSLLFKFRPLVINPELAERIGLNEAIVLQQLNYWLTETESGIEVNGRRWVYNTHDQWAKQFPFWSVDTVKRALTVLTKQGIVIAEKLQKSQRNHTNFYTIEFEHPALTEEGNLPSSKRAKAPSSEEGKMHQSTGADCPDVKRANCPVLLTEITTETTTEITAETSQQGGAAESVPAVLSKQKQKASTSNTAELGALPEWIPAEAWVAFVEMRKAMGSKGKLTPAAAKLIIKKLGELAAQGHPPGAVLEQSVMNNWRGVFELKNQQSGGRQQQLETRNRSAIEEFVNGGQRNG